MARKRRTDLENKTVQWLRDHQYYADVCSRHVGRVSFDLFGFADVIGFRGTEILLVQVTDTTNVSHRLAKIRDNHIACAWVAAGHPLAIAGWGPDRKDMEPKRVRPVALEDFQP